MPRDYKQDRSCYNESKQPIMEQPEMQQPIMEQPEMQQPMMQQPSMCQPTMQQPMMQQPMMQQPMMHQVMYPGMCQMDMCEYICDMNERDLEYMKRMHSELNKKIQRHVEYECDRMDYDGSPMYDEYLDNQMVEQMVDRLYERVVNEMPELLEEEEKDRQRVPRRRLVRSLTGALLLSEIYGRRQRYRRRYPYYGSSYYGYPYYNSPYYGYPYSYY